MSKHFTYGNNRDTMLLFWLRVFLIYWTGFSLSTYTTSIIRSRQTDNLLHDIIGVSIEVFCRKWNVKKVWRKSPLHTITKDPYLESNCGNEITFFQEHKRKGFVEKDIYTSRFKFRFIFLKNFLTINVKDSGGRPHQDPDSSRRSESYKGLLPNPLSQKNSLILLLTKKVGDLTNPLTRPWLLD